MKNVLFLCTGNSARSILAECYLNHSGQDKFTAYSAGSMPTGTPNPLSIKTLEAHHIPLTTGDGEGPRSKSWDMFAEADAPKMDFVITVCDNAAGEVCPIWPTKKGGAAPQKHHWSFPDPAAATGSEKEKLSVFETIFVDIRQHIDHFIAKETT